MGDGFGFLLFFPYVFFPNGAPVLQRIKTRGSRKKKKYNDKTVWYGSVNFLSFGTNEESIMRFDSFDLAGVLAYTVL